MKKFLLAVVTGVFASSLYAQDSLKLNLINAVNKSNTAQVESLLPSASAADIDTVLKAAVYACKRQGKNSKNPRICNKEENKKIISLLLKKGADANKINLVRRCPLGNCALWQIYEVESTLSLLNQSNSLASEVLMPYMDKCLTILAQIQEKNAKDKNYISYFEGWRVNKCNLKKFKVSNNIDDEEGGKRVLEIGLGKEEIKKAYGTPLFVDNPSKNLELLTYKKSPKGEGAFVYIISNGLVTSVEFRDLSYGKEMGPQKEDSPKERQASAAGKKTPSSRG